MGTGNIKTIDWRPDPELDFPSQRPGLEYHAMDKEIDKFQHDGVVFLKGVFDNWVDPLRRGLERQLAQPLDYAFPCESVLEGEPGRFYDSYCNWHRIPEYLDFIFRSEVASMVGQFMCGNTAQFFHEHVFCKEAGTQVATPWHHDFPYYSIEGKQTASVYVSLDYIPEETAVKFVAGSHRWGDIFFARHFVDGTNYTQNNLGLKSVPDIDRNVGMYDVRSWSLDPGDAILFDFRTLHGTTSARNLDRRRAFSTRWLGDDVVYMYRPGETSPPLDLIKTKSGERMPEDWFPIIWRRRRD